MIKRSTADYNSKQTSRKFMKTGRRSRGCAIGGGTSNFGSLSLGLETVSRGLSTSPIVLLLLLLLLLLLVSPLFSARFDRGGDKGIGPPRQPFMALVSSLSARGTRKQSTDGGRWSQAWPMEVYCENTRGLRRIC